MLEVLLSGDSPGLGPGVRRALTARAVTVASAREFFAERGIEPPQKGHDVYAQWDAFVRERTKDPGSEATATALASLQRHAELLPRVKAPPLAAEQAVIGEKQSAGLEEQKRVQTRSQHKTAVSPLNNQQVLIANGGQEYVIDRLGQLVPRILVRSISPRNYKELRDLSAIYPSAISPTGSGAQAGGAGGADNAIKQASSEMRHVQGAKPSPFLSATTTREEAKNPQGQDFGETNKKGRKWTPVVVTIDLAYIDPVDIRALYTHRVFAYWMLEGYPATRPTSSSSCRPPPRPARPPAPRRRSTSPASRRATRCTTRPVRPWVPATSAARSGRRSST